MFLSTAHLTSSYLIYHSYDVGRATGCLPHIVVVVGRVALVRCVVVGSKPLKKTRLLPGNGSSKEGKPTEIVWWACKYNCGVVHQILHLVGVLVEYWTRRGWRTQRSRLSWRGWSMLIAQRCGCGGYGRSNSKATDHLDTSKIRKTRTSLFLGSSLCGSNIETFGVTL